jgi:hypothetical protein
VVLEEANSVNEDIFSTAALRLNEPVSFLRIELLPELLGKADRD